MTVLSLILLAFHSNFVSYARHRKRLQGKLMSASSPVVYLRSADFSAAARTSRGKTIPAKKTAPRRWLFRGPRQPTTFHRCLAMHLLVAERCSALD
jgi:hypothetical protein